MPGMAKAEGGIAAGRQADMADVPKKCRHGDSLIVDRSWSRLVPSPDRTSPVTQTWHTCACMAAVQGPFLKHSLGGSTADSSLPACGAVPVLRLVPQISVLTAPSADGGPELRLQAAARASEQLARATVSIDSAPPACVPAVPPARSPRRHVLPARVRECSNGAS